MIKNILNEKKVNYSLILFLLSMVVLNTYILISINLKENSKDNIFRLHVVANSNSIEDQITKLKVETEIEKYFKNINYSENDNIYEILTNNSNKILEISNDILNNDNKDYSSKLDIGKIHYDKKENILYSMEEGTYNSARLILGNGNGKNIWTIIFPNKDTIKSIEELDTIMPGLKNIYDDVEYENINKTENNTIEYDFKLKEIFDKIQKHLNL